ncbi:MAG TPA: hypothetical protein VJS92_06115 [Candidatus Polarisedimenticolaceae bacterium]|nr:hypothetical protein [Candidatus Polarisedimenticolaceae bacterium]
MRFALAIALAGLLAAPAAADGIEDDPLVQRILALDRQRVTRYLGLRQANVSRPLVLSATLGVLRARVPVDYDCRTTCDLHGATFQLEGGLGGGKLSAGHALLLVEQKERDARFFSRVFTALGVKGSLLRTWGEAPERRRDRTYAGAELDYTAINIHLSFGVFYPLTRTSGQDRDSLISLGFGWGF